MKSTLRTFQRSYLRIEELESRRLLSGFQPTAAEQILLEQLNDIRANPAAYGASIGVDLSGVAPSQPLAFDPILIQAALLHAQDMNTRGYFDHNTPEAIDPGQRLTNAGFLWTSWGESLAGGSAYPNSASALSALILDAGIADLGHRHHLLATDAVFQTQNAVGIGIVQNGSGPLTNYYVIDTAAAVTSNLPILTGSVFKDANGNGRYDIGEGLANVQLTVTGDTNSFTTVSFDSGGYSIALNPGTYTVTASGGGLTTPISQVVTISTGNFRLGFAVPSASVNPDANAWISQLYADILGRTASSGDVAGWVNAYNSGTAPSAIVHGFLTSAEYSQDLVRQWFNQYLHRNPDPTGLGVFTSELQSNVTEAAVRSSILASAEYFGIHGGTSANFVAGVYQDVLGRAPAGNEAASWIQQANTGNRLGVAQGILASPEFKTEEVQQFYAKLLRRNADPTGLATFVPMLTQGQDERTVIQGIMASAEYFGSAHRVLWLEGVYRDVLHRGGDTVGDLGSWLAALHLSHDRTALAKSILTSTEAENLTVRSLYQHLLGRKPDASGLAAYVHLLDADGHATTLITSLVTSTEYYNLHGANTSLWIRALYQDLLNRGASDLEVQFWINKMNNGETRAQVAADFTATLEYQRDFVGGLFLSYLRRQPTTLDLSQNVTQVQGGASDATLAAALLGSPEYFALNG